MKPSTFDALIGFLQGIFWAFIAIGAWITFQIASVFGLAIAIFSVFMFLFFSLLGLLLLENMRINRLRFDELLKQTRLLEEIRSERRVEMAEPLLNE